MQCSSPEQDDRIRAVIAQIGGYGFPPEYRANARARAAEKARGLINPVVPQGGLDASPGLKGTPDIARMATHSPLAAAANIRVPTLIIDAEQEELMNRLEHGFIPKLSKRNSEGDSQIGVCLIQGGEHGRFAMPIPLRADFDAGMVRAAAKRSKDGPQARRLLALAAIYEGASRTEAAKIGGVTLQIVRDWVMKFNAHGPEGLIDCKPPGQPSRLNGAHRAALAAILESGPIPAVHGVVRWRIVDLCQWIFEEFRVVVAKQTLSRELRAMGYRKLSARPRHHEQAGRDREF